jgi:hypothetical protein
MKIHERDLALLARMTHVCGELGIVVARTRAAHAQGDAPDVVSFRKIGGALQALGVALLARADELDGTKSERRGLCAQCGIEPVARLTAVSMVDGQFCADCIDRCLTDDRCDHWCPVDAFARATETQG